MNRREFLKASGIVSAAVLASGCGLPKKVEGQSSEQKTFLPYVTQNREGTNVTLPKNLLINPGTVIEDFENVGEWEFAPGVAVQDSNHVISGAKSIQMNGAMGGTVQMTKNINFTLPAFDFGRFYIYVQDVTKTYSVRIYLINSPGNYYTIAFSTGTSAGWGQGLRTGWNLLQFTKNEFSAYGSPNWSSPVTKIQINSTSRSGQISVVSLDSLIFGVAGQPAIIFSMDDGRKGQYDAFIYMQKYHMVATAYIISDFIGDGSHLTEAQLIEMNNYGWDIGNHTRDHKNLVTGGLSDAQITAEYADCKAYLDGIGLTRASSHGSMPYSDWTPACTVDAQAAGMLSIRDDTYTNRYFGLPHGSWFLWPRFGNMLNKYTSLAQAKARIDNTLSRQQSLVFLLDGISSVAGETDWALADFKALVDYVAGLKLQTVTTTELYRLTAGSITVGHN